MLKLISTFYIILVSSEVCFGWHTKSCLVDHMGYTRQMFQAVMHEIENDVKFCNFNVQDFNRTINDRLYTFTVSGLAQYKNSFLISMQSANMNAITAQITRRTVNSVSEYEALVRATMNFIEPTFGFDVRVDLDDGTTHTTTSTFTFDSISFPFFILKLINTNVTTVTTSFAGQSSRFRRMEFHPDTNVTQVLSRHFQGFDIDNNFDTWGRDILVPMIQRFATTKIAFPEIRFDGC